MLRWRRGNFFGCGLAALFVSIFCPRSIAGDAPQPPTGWRIELVAQAPDIRHPSVVCVSPDDRVFVAEDPMDISTPHADAQEGRILCLQPDGRQTVFAEKLHAVFGMQYLEGRLYVLHNPQFSVFTDDHGAGKDRVELIESMNPNPWALDWNDHVPANFRLAMDGYFYVAVGDKGVYGAIGRDGSRVEMRGGILRLRPDGTDLEVYCTGVRNILDVALSEEDEVFTYDNTDEHDWMGRLTHMVDGGFYGYPYDFVPRRPYTLWMMHDFGGGAATGTLCYNDDALPVEYQGNLFLGDFGKQQILRARLERDGASFRLVAHDEFFQNPPADFRPVGIAFGADGLSLYVCDWQHRDTKENVVVGRLWKATYRGPSRATPKPAWYLPAAMGQPCSATSVELVHALAHPSKNVRLTAQLQIARRKESGLLAGLVGDTSAPARARWHAIWALDAIDGGKAGRDAILAAAQDKDPSVRRQAIRQLGTRQVTGAVPTLLARLDDGDGSVRFQAAMALGRIGDSAAVPKLLEALEERPSPIRDETGGLRQHLGTGAPVIGTGERDSFARYALFTALNRIGRKNGAAWREIARGLDSEVPAVAEATKFALRGTYDRALLEVLLAIATDGGRKLDARESALDLAAALHHQEPAWKGEWWAYHPALAPPPIKSVAWDGTPKITLALRAMVDAAEPRLRAAAVNGLELADVTESAFELRRRFEHEPAPEVRRAIIRALGRFQDTAFSAPLARLLSERSCEAATLSEAVRAASRIGGDEVKAALLDMAATPAVNSALRLEALDTLGQSKARDAVAGLESLLTDGDRAIRAAAIKAVAQIGGEEALRALRPLASDSDLCREAVIALGSLRDTNAVPDLLAAWRAPETRQEALAGLAQVSDLRALDAYLEGLASANAALREQCRKAVTQVREAALPLIEQRVSTLTSDALGELRRIYKGSAESGPLFAGTTQTLELGDYEKYALEHPGDPPRGQRIFFDDGGVACAKCHAIAGRGGAVGPDLTLIGGQFPRRDLIEHVLNPSKVVREGYRQFVVETREGETFSGLVKGETAETLTLLDSEGRLQSIPKNRVAARAPSNLSLMPEGLAFGLTLEQFADLIGYLESRRADPRAPALETPPAPPAPPAESVALVDGREQGRELPEGATGVRGLARDSAEPQRAEFQVGAAATVINPPLGTPLAGYYSERGSEGVLDDIHAKAAVMSDGKTRVALVVCDLLTLPRRTVLETRELIEQQTGIPGGNVMISATHQHTGPVVARESSRDDLDGGSGELDRAYSTELPELIARSVADAAARLTPGRVWFARGSEQRLAFNRRYWMKDGTVGWNPGKSNPDTLRPVGPTDPEVGVIYFDSTNATPLLTYVNFAMHPDTTGGKRISADYPGALSRALAGYQGPDMVTLFANGACGNLNHLNVNWSARQQGTNEANRLGTILAGSVFKAYMDLKPVSDTTLRVRSELVALPLPRITDDDVAEAKAVLKRMKTANFMELVKTFKVLDVAGRAGKPWEVEVQVVALGKDLAWVSLPGEIFVELGLNIKAVSPFAQTQIAELANGSIGYIPNRSAYAEGNYEVVSARCAEGSGEMLVAAAVRMLEELHGEAEHERSRKQ